MYSVTTFFCVHRDKTLLFSGLLIIDRALSNVLLLTYLHLRASSVDNV